jgi:RimJ/RimL family protein N-acetyltransferase
VTLETPRLRLLPWDERGLELVLRLSALPEITRYIGDGSAYSPDAAATMAERQAAHWREHGWGSYVGVERATGAAVALISQNRVGDATPGLEPSEHEIGWWVDPAAWGRGYAREGGEALVRNAFAVVGSPAVVARIQPANTASLRVAGALGLRYEFASTGRAGEVVHVLRRNVTDPR